MKSLVERAEHMLVYADKLSDSGSEILSREIRAVAQSVITLSEALEVYTLLFEHKECADRRCPCGKIARAALEKVNGKAGK